MRRASEEELELVDTVGQKLMPKGGVFVAALAVVIYLNEEGRHSYTTVINGSELDSASILGYVQMAAHELTLEALPELGGE